jgi:hypothetical protein
LGHAALFLQNKLKTTQEKLSEEEVADSPVLVETCDKCGESVKATHTATKNGFVLYFCGHHIRDLSENLKKDGFGIAPEYIGY